MERGGTGQVCNLVVVMRLLQDLIANTEEWTADFGVNTVTTT